MTELGLLQNNITVRMAIISDITEMVNLSKAKRLNYEKAQPQFWRRAIDAENTQAKWFEDLLLRDDHLLLIAILENRIIGFIIGRIVPAPEVYDPGGLTLMIDDFCVENPDLWDFAGNKLLMELRKSAESKGAAQTLVVCGAYDEPKRQFLMRQNLSIASEWFVGKI